jgi:hypothetical protein
MGTQLLGYNWVTLSLGVTSTEAWSSRLGVGCNKSCHQEIQSGKAVAHTGLL